MIFQKLISKIYEDHEEVFLGDIVRLLREIIEDVDCDVKVGQVFTKKKLNLFLTDKVALLLEQYLINGERTIAPTEFLVIIIIQIFLRYSLYMFEYYVNPHLNHNSIPPRIT